MKKEQIQELFQQFENICYFYNGIECWSARELQQLLGYSKWDNFIKVIEKAKKAAENAEIKVSDHFAGIGKMIDLAKGAKREIDDFATELTSHNVVDKALKGVTQITREHVENNMAVRKMLLERGVRPEALPPSEDVKKLQRKLDSEEKKITREAKKLS